MALAYTTPLKFHEHGTLKYHTKNFKSLIIKSTTITVVMPTLTADQKDTLEKDPIDRISKPDHFLEWLQFHN